MNMPGILGNAGVKGIGGLAALEGLNTLGSKFHGLYDAEVGDLIGSVAGAVDSGLEMIGVNGALASNPLFETIATGAGIGTAVALSDSIMKDFGLVSEGNTWAIKNMTRYAANIAAGTGAFVAGSAAIPYIIGGALVYGAGKKGWTGSKETLKGLYSGIGGIAKDIITSPIGGYKAIKNSFGMGNFKKNPQTR